MERDFAVVQGLATGIDKAAHTAALEAGGRTIAVIGTPLGESDPKENADIQAYIAKEQLLVCIRRDKKIENYTVQISTRDIFGVD